MTVGINMRRGMIEVFGVKQYYLLSPMQSVLSVSDELSVNSVKHFAAQSCG